jgi:hypothetical protein
MSKEPTEAAYVMSGQFTPDNRARPSRDDASNESSQGIRRSYVNDESSSIA